MYMYDRAAHLAWISVIAMGGLGATAMITYAVRSLSFSRTSPLSLMIVFAFIFGSTFGFVSMLFVVFGLMKKRLKHSLPFVYGPSLVAVIVHASTHRVNDAFGTAQIALIAVCALSVIGFFVLPNAPEIKRGHCPQCEYDLRGNLSAGCPECSWKRNDGAPDTMNA